jgi:hypothetical protein
MLLRGQPLRPVAPAGGGLRIIARELACGESVIQKHRRRKIGGGERSGRYLSANERRTLSVKRR